MSVYPEKRRFHLFKPRLRRPNFVFSVVVNSLRVLAIVLLMLALAGVGCMIPADECIEAMARVGAALPESLRETSEGGLAATPTGRELRRRVFGK